MQLRCELSKFQRTTCDPQVANAGKRGNDKSVSLAHIVNPFNLEEKHSYNPNLTPLLQLNNEKHTIFFYCKHHTNHIIKLKLSNLRISN
jgi:hypothetical protein